MACSSFTVWCCGCSGEMTGASVHAVLAFKTIHESCPGLVRACAADWLAELAGQTVAEAERIVAEAAQ